MRQRLRLRRLHILMPALDMDTRKKIAIVIILIGFAGGIVLWFVSTERTKLPASENQPIPTEQAQKFQLKELGQEAYSLLKQAAKENKPELCDKFILGIDRDNCLLYVFQANTDAAICQKIADEQLKKNCLDLDILNRAITAKNPSSCSEIKNDIYKNQCQKILVGEFGKIEDCAAETGEVKSLCESSVYYKIAMKEQKLELCDKITDIAYKVDCEKTLKNLPKDQDQDGLSDDYEVSLGTNPFKADSDGDGMNDGEEMKAHRNPLLKGK